LSEKFNRHTTHLLCAEPTGIKYDKAIEWGVPVVSDSWLWTMARSGRIEPAEDHALDKDGKSAGDCVKQGTCSVGTAIRIRQCFLVSTLAPRNEGVFFNS
jgi:hypothetical protein